MRIKLMLVLTLFIACSSLLAGLPTQRRFENLSLKDGLSQSVATALLKDQKGYLWIGTQNGLNRYDGYNFEVFLDNGNPGDFEGTYVLTLDEGPDGTIWIGTYGQGFHAYDYQTNSFTSYPYLSNQPDGLAESRVRAILAEEKGLWLGLFRAGLQYYNLADQSFTHYPESTDGLRQGRVRDIYRDSKQRLWIITSRGGLHLFDEASQSFSLIPSREEDPHGVLSHRGGQIMEDRNGDLWIGHWGSGGLSRLRKEAPDFHFDIFPPGESSDQLPESAIFGLQEDPRGYLWIGTNKHGLFRFDPITGKADPYRHSPYDPTSLPADRIQSLLIDEHQVLWAGTFGAGIGKLPRLDPLFQLTRHQPDIADSLSSNDIWSIYQDFNKTLWVGTLEGGLNRLDPRAKGFKHYQHDPQDPTSISDNDVVQVTRDKQGTLWLATLGGGLNKYNAESDSFTHYMHDPQDPTSIPSNNVKAVAEDRYGNFWVLSNGGLTLWDRNKESARVWQHNADDPMSLSHDYTIDVFEGPGDQLWVATLGGGICLLDPTTLEFTAFHKHDDSNPNTLSSDMVHELHFDRLGNFWAATQDGLNLYHPEQKTWRRFDRKDGLPNTNVYGIENGAGGDLWFATDSGIVRFSLEEGVKNVFTVNDGLQSNEFNRGAHFSGRDGFLYFGGIAGLNRFLPERIDKDPYPPHVSLSAFRKFNKDVPLDTHPALLQQLDLTWRDRVISFEFMADNLRNPASNRYQVYLEGFHDDWLDLGTEHYVTFTNLDPSSYNLRVRAANADSVWGEAKDLLQLTVKPPPWATWWAYILYAIILVAIVMLLINFQRRKLIMERYNNEQLRRLDRMKDEFLANTSHELRTPLNGIIGIAESLADGAAGPIEPQMRQNLAMIIWSGRKLAQLVDDVLDFSKLKADRLEIRHSAVDLFALVDVVLSLARPSIGNKKLSLKNRVPRDFPLVDADENRLLQVLHNLVGNAVKFTHQGHVRVTAKIEKGHAIIAVSDTGIGIAKDQQKRIFQSFEHGDGNTARKYGGTGLGLTISKQLIERMHGKLTVESQPGKGSIFAFTLPLAPPNQKQSNTHLPQVRALRASYDDLFGSFNKPINELAPSLSPAPTTAAAVPEQAQAPPQAQHSKTILIVDDEIVNRRVLVNFLKALPYNLLEAESGPAALEILDNQKVDLVLLDIMMPRMTGFEACQELRKRFNVHELPVIFLTAKDQVKDLVTAFSAGGNDYLTKPIAREELLSRVRTHMQLKDINETLERKVAERTHKLESQNRELETLDSIVKTINKEIELRSLLKLLLEQGMVLFPQAERGSVLIWEAPQKQFRFAATAGYELFDMERMTYDYDVISRRYTQDSREIIDGVYLIEDARTVLHPSIPEAKSMLSMAVTIDANFEGFLVFDNYQLSNAFDDSDVRRLSRFREHAISAIAKARYLEDLQLKNREIVTRQKQLVMQEKMASLGLLTAGVAHEIKNPLNFITNFAELTQELLGDLQARLNHLNNDDQEVAELLNDLIENAQRIREHGHRADNIVESMMALTRDTGRNRELTDLNKLISKCADLTVKGRARAAAQQPVDVELKLHPSLPLVETIARNMGRVIVNILGNALDALEQRRSESNDPDYQPKLIIETNQTEQQVKMIFHDNGVGIPQQHLGDVFNPFYTTKSPGKGSIGLGLSVCYDIVTQENDGTIEIESQEGEWTKVTVTLNAS